uniref:Ephrin RBD domain-containing protein n=1 Tax=Globodera pallida TaxID=36090 RepID=A0A183CGG2_GLOPA
MSFLFYILCFLAFLLAFCPVYGVFRAFVGIPPQPRRERLSREERNKSSGSSEAKDILTLEVRPSLAGNPLHAYRYIVQCGTMKIREHSRPESELLRWSYPMLEPERVLFDFPTERCGGNFAVYIFMCRRNQIDVNLWNKQYQMRISERNFLVEFHHYMKLDVSPSLAQLSNQITHFKSETMVVLLDNPNCVAFTKKLWVVWPNQRQLGKPKMVKHNVGMRGQVTPVHEVEFSNHFLLEITPKLGHSRAYVVYVWCAGDKKSKRMKFTGTIREELCSRSKCSLMVLINSKYRLKKKGLYDIAVAEADEDWASNIGSDEFPEQIVFSTMYGMSIDNGATLSWQHPRTKTIQSVYLFF